MGQVRRKLSHWGTDNFAAYPWRTEGNPWVALAAEVLLQRTRASAVRAVYADFKRAFGSPGRLAVASEAEVEAVLGSLGLHWRTRLLCDLAKEVEERGRVPDDLTELKSLPGVGDYVAGAYLSLHREIRAVLIDANIVRWVCRLVGVEWNGETRRRKWLREEVEKLTPRRGFRSFNYALLDFTMTICVKRPRCMECPLKRCCVYGVGLAAD